MHQKAQPKVRLNYRVFDTIDKALEDWKQVFHENLFLKPSYLRALEKALPDDMQVFYMVTYHRQKPMGLVYFQLKRYVTSESLKRNDTGFFCTLSRIMRETLGKIEVKLLVVGNLLLTGQNAFTWDERQIDQSGFLELLVDILDSKPKELAPYDVVMYKDFAQPNHLKKLGAFQFTIDPSMHIYLRQEWSDFDDYLQALNSKYRIRAKRAAKKLGNVSKIRFELADIKQYHQQIFQLYTAIATQQAFNIVNLDPRYFYALKQSLGEQYQFVAYFDQDKMIGFYSYILDGDSLEAYYVGLDHAHNTQRQLYLNILFDFIKEGIRHNVQCIALSRTALEIKSSVGAVPRDMYCYLRHNKKWGRVVLPHLVNYFKPKVEWKARSPFKSISE